MEAAQKEFEPAGVYVNTASIGLPPRRAVEALNEAMCEEMDRDSRVFLMGEEVAQYNGAYKVSQGMLDRFGPRRVLAAGVVWWGVFTALTAAVPLGISGALIWFIAIRFLFGAGEAHRGARLRGDVQVIQGHVAVVAA